MLGGVARGRLAGDMLARARLMLLSHRFHVITVAKLPTTVRRHRGVDVRAVALAGVAGEPSSCCAALWASRLKCGLPSFSAFGRGVSHDFFFASSNPPHEGPCLMCFSVGPCVGHHRRRPASPRKSPRRPQPTLQVSARVAAKCGRHETGDARERAPVCRVGQDGPQKRIVRDRCACDSLASVCMQTTKRGPESSRE